jgi:hypothetical protein
MKKSHSSETRACKFARVFLWSLLLPFLLPIKFSIRCWWRLKEVSRDLWWLLDALILHKFRLQNAIRASRFSALAIIYVAFRNNIRVTYTRRGHRILTSHVVDILKYEHDLAISKIEQALQNTKDREALRKILNRTKVILHNIREEFEWCLTADYMDCFIVEEMVSQHLYCILVSSRMRDKIHNSAYLWLNDNYFSRVRESLKEHTWAAKKARKKKLKSPSRES